MKFTLSLAVLALAASQAMAVVPTPIAECTKTVIVQPTDTGCADFAAVNGCTFDDMLKWNLKLRPDCMNLGELIRRLLQQLLHHTREYNPIIYKGNNR